MLPIQSQLRTERLAGMNTLGEIRADGAALDARASQLSRASEYTPQHKATTIQRDREQTHATRRERLTPVLQRIDGLLKLVSTYTKDAWIAKQDLPLPTDASNPTLSALLRSTELMRLEQLMSRLSSDNLRSMWAEAMSAGNLALASILYREADYRTRDDDADVSDRELLASFRVQLEALSIPELDSVQDDFYILGKVREWLVDSLNALLTGDDLGVRDQARFQLTRSGYTGPTIMVDGIVRPADRAQPSIYDNAA